MATTAFRTMVFVDGSNFLVQLGQQIEARISADNPPPEAISLAYHCIASTVTQLGYQGNWIRSCWYSSYRRSDGTDEQLREYLWRSRFEPNLFKTTGGREKGVDIALTKDMLAHAFRKNYDVAVLVAGDEDYVQLVQEAKRYGGRVIGAFVSSGLSPALRRAEDNFINMDAFTNNQGIAPTVHILREKARAKPRPKR